MNGWRCKAHSEALQWSDHVSSFLCIYDFRLRSGVSLNENKTLTDSVTIHFDWRKSSISSMTMKSITELLAMSLWTLNSCMSNPTRTREKITELSLITRYCSILNYFHLAKYGFTQWGYNLQCFKCPIKRDWCRNYYFDVIWSKVIKDFIESQVKLEVRRLSAKQTAFRCNFLIPNRILKPISNAIFVLGDFLPIWLCHITYRNDKEMCLRVIPAQPFSARRKKFHISPKPDRNIVWRWII